MKKKPCIFLCVVMLTHAAASGILSQNLDNYNSRYSTQLKKAVMSFEKLLDYVQQPRSVVGDMIFGFVLAEAQLSILKKHIEKGDSKNGIISTDLISSFEQRCRTVKEKYMPKRLDKTEAVYNTIMDHVVDEELWKYDIPIREGRLQAPCGGKTHCRELDKLLKLQDRDFIMMGTPEEQDSDQCLGQLTVPIECSMSLKCRYIMTNDKEVHGYPLTHRLLYFLTAERLGCGRYVKFSGLQKTTAKLCSQILVDMYHIIGLGLPPLFRDLYLEQMTLCGIEGFAEFLNPYSIDWIVDQQTSSGCFTEMKGAELIKNSTTPEHHRVKRNDGTLGEDGCTMHITGMAAIALTINIRALVEYWIPKTPQTK